MSGSKPEVELPPDAPVHKEYGERDGLARGDAARWWLPQLEGVGLLTGGQDNVREDLFQGLVVLVGLDLDALQSAAGSRAPNFSRVSRCFSRTQAQARTYSSSVAAPSASSSTSGCRSCSRLGVRRERRSSMTGERMFQPGVTLAQAARWSMTGTPAGNIRVIDEPCTDTMVTFAKSWAA